MKKLINNILIGVVVLFTTSCEKFLEVQSKNSLTLDNYYTTYEECRAATAPLYNKVWHTFAGSFYWDFGDGRGNNTFTPYGTGVSYIHLSETSETPSVENGWSALYAVVTQSDYVINNIDKALENGVTLAQVNACKAEARFMRGLAYWYLGSIWGNIPIIEDPGTTANHFLVKTNPFEDVLQYAIRDLEFAAQWLPKTDDKGRVTRYSALSALARVYTSAACYARGNKFSGRWTKTATDYYTLAKDAAKEVCENTNYKLMTNYEELFRVQNNNNSESLFALQWVPGSSTWGAGNGMQNNLAYSTDLTNGLNAWGGSLFASGDVLKLMHDRAESVRLKGTFFCNGAVYNYLGAHTAEKTWTVKDRWYPTVKKHVVGGAQDTEGLAMNNNSGLATPMIRLAEVYLLYAEAILGIETTDRDGATTNADALYYFNEVRKRAKLAEVSSITLANIWDERRCELTMEGQFWYDMVRRAYWDQDWVLNYMNNQNRARYYYYKRETAPDGFAWRDTWDGKELNPATADRLILPYPASDVVMNPLLRETPEPFNFGE